MKIKNVVLFFVVCATMLLNSFCFAEVSTYDLEIGGIYYNQPMADIVSRYGDSIKTENRAPAGYNFTFLVDGSEILISPSSNQFVLSANIKDNSKLLTNRGIGLGHSLKELIEAYGRPDVSKENSFEKTFNVIYYTENKDAYIIFILDENNIIKFIGYDVNLDVK